MIKYKEGTVFNAGADAIVNTVNCDGFMGAGLALEFALRYPKMLEDYQKKCKEKIIKIGKVDYFKTNDVTIINFPTKSSFKFSSLMPYIEKGLKDFVETYKEHNIKSVAFPKLGCSNGGLNWEDVKQIMERYLSNLDIDVYFCLDSLKEAEGKEKVMIEDFNKMSIDNLSIIVTLNQNQKNILNQYRPYKRFWQISKTQGIGKTTYKKLFKYFYESNELPTENLFTYNKS